MSANLSAARDQATGIIAALGGGSGLTIQWITDFSSLILIFLNLLLALGGLVLLKRRNRIAKLQEKDLQQQADRALRADPY